MANTIVISTSPLIGSLLAADTSLATLPLGAQFATIMVTTMPASHLMARLGRSQGLAIGACAAFVAGILGAVAIIIASFWLFILASISYGIFGAFAGYYRFAAADAADAGNKSGADRRGRAISWVMAGGVVAAVLGPQLAVATRDAIPPYTFAGSHLVISAIALATLALLPGVRLPRMAPPIRGQSGRPLAEIFSQRPARVALLAAIAAYLSMNLLMTATPLAMQFGGHSFSDSAFVIQWHVLGMFGPSFFTGPLIARFGVYRVIVAGVGLICVAAVVNLSGVELFQFVVGLFLLGLGWNLMFIGGTTLLTQCYRPIEKAKVQGFNDLVLFSVVALSAGSSGFLHQAIGWQSMNIMVLPVMLLVAAITITAGFRDGGARQHSDGAASG